MTLKQKISIPVVLLIFSLMASACSPALSVLQSLPLAQQSPTAIPATAAPAATSQQPAVNIPVSGAALDALQALQTTYEQVYQAVNPSVVNIQVEISASGVSSDLPSNTHPFTIPDTTQSALGSGFIWDTQGHIVTNNHVIDGASQILVTFADGNTVEAKLVGADPQSDLAVIQVDPSGLNLRPLTLVDSNSVHVGQLAIAIGNPYGLSGTMTEGIVSALSRSLPVSTASIDGVDRGSYTIPDIIQTNAAINPGNSGGVLVDVEGKVIGVTAAIRSSTDSNSGIGFVIPANIVNRVVPVLISKGSYNHPRLGITATTVNYSLAKVSGLDTSTHGVLVINVTKGSAADKAGLQGSTTSDNNNSTPSGGDIITAIDGHPVKTFEDLTSYLFSNTEVGQKVQLTILRDGKQQTIELTLAASSN